MRFSKNHCKIQFIICACLLTVVICDRVIQSSEGTTKFHTKDSLASKSAQHIESKLGSGSSPSKLRHHLNQATNQRQPSDVENKKSAPFHHADMECSGMKCPKTHEAAPSESQYPGQLPQNNTRAQVQTSDLGPPLPTETTDTESPLVENGIYWSREVEEILPKGLTDEQYNAWTKKVGHLTVIYMEKGTLTKCGRDGNAYVILSDGTQMCVRHSKHGNTGLLGHTFQQ
ncbi:Four-jointed box protein 1 [Holothuria leucospilota]|uniref:Four-jointed box protein 1 n=1 Tax=Holothuria leucospilota TaxID=206669 RepID=A0A9Q0YM87_HOLLE|nr:Four-jointed box protein 1 [Holothuria leucospilota]